MLTQCNSFNEFARSLGMSPARLEAMHCKTDREIVDGLAPLIQKHDSKLTRKEVLDAATNFTTHHLASMLQPVEIVNNTNFLFVPGRGDNPPLIPVVSNIELGDRSVQWQSVALTGEAVHFGPGATRDLRRVDSADDQSEQAVTYWGVIHGWDMFELAQGGKLGRRIESENAAAASQAMAETMERMGGFGYNARKIPGMFNHGAAFTVDLPVSFGNPAITYEQALEQMCVIDLVWGRANPRRRVSGVVMPRSHKLNLMKIFIGANEEGGGLWKWALEMFPWLSNIIEDDRMLTAANDGGSQWTLWSADSMDLFHEASAPMVFGPFEDQFDTTFITMQMGAGVICRRPELLFRFQMPA
jgi:hypothetical protein